MAQGRWCGPDEKGCESRLYFHSSADRRAWDRRNKMTKILAEVEEE